MVVVLVLVVIIVVVAVVVLVVVIVVVVVVAVVAVVVAKAAVQIVFWCGSSPQVGLGHTLPAGVSVNGVPQERRLISTEKN